MKELRVCLMISLILLQSACALWKSDDDSEVKPAPLPVVKTEVKLDVLWTHEIGEGGGKAYSKLTPAVGEDKIFVADYRGTVVALDLKTGRELWKVELKTALAGGVSVVAGKVLLGTLDGEVIALSSEQGQIVWRNALGSEIVHAPAADATMVALHTVDGKIYALSIADGHTLWFRDYSTPALTLRGTSAPRLYQGGVITTLANGKVVVWRASDGQTIWERPVAQAKGRSELERVVDIDADPVIDGSTLYVVGYHGYVAALDLNGGEILWQRAMSSYLDLSLDREKIYLTDEQSIVHSLSRYGGSEVWSQNLLQDRYLTAPTVWGDSVVVGDYEGYIHLLAPSDGHLQAQLSIGDDGFAADPLVTADGVLIVLGRQGTLKAIQRSVKP